LEEEKKKTKHTFNHYETTDKAPINPDNNVKSTPEFKAKKEIDTVNS
jgi:hypothetical protein